MLFNLVLRLTDVIFVGLWLFEWKVEEIIWNELFYLRKSVVNEYIEILNLLFTLY